MIYTRTENYGIDSKIKRIQEHLNTNLGWNDMHIYGRLYSNQINADAVGSTTSVGELIPEWYLGDGEYKQVFIDDNVSAVIGFIVRERVLVPLSAEVDIIFTINMDEIYDTKGREDEKAILQAIKALKGCGIQEVTELMVGIDDVFSGYDKAGLAFRDIHPLFNFSLKCVIPYTNNICNGD